MCEEVQLRVCGWRVVSIRDQKRKDTSTSSLYSAAHLRPVYREQFGCLCFAHHPNAAPQTLVKASAPQLASPGCRLAQDSEGEDLEDVS